MNQNVDYMNSHRLIAGAAGLALAAVMAFTAVAQTPGEQAPQPPRGERGNDRPFDRGFDGPRDRGPRGFGPGARGFGQIMEPEFLHRDMPVFVDVLDLDKSQTPILETLFLDYEAAFGEAADAMRDKFAAVRPQSPEAEQRAQERRAVGEQMRLAIQELRQLRAAAPQPETDGARDAENQAKSEAALARIEQLRQQLQQLRPTPPQGEELARFREQMTALGAEWRNTRQQIRNGFVGDVQTILTDEQRTIWPDLERRVRRDKTLPRSQFAGEGVDLFRVVREMQLTADEVTIIEPVLDQYAIALDAALVARNNRLETMRGEMLASMMGRDVEKAKTLAAEEVTLRTNVRNVNEQFTQQIAQALGEQHGQTFTDLVVQRSFPRIERPTFAQRSFDAALELEGLSPETMAAIESVQAQYLAAAKARNAELRAAVRENEPREIEMRIEFWAARMNNQEPPQPAGDLRGKFEDRLKLDQDFRRQLESLLTAEQIALLPPVPAIDGEGGRRGPMRSFDARDRGDDQRRQEMMQRFDRNGDGQLDETERDAMRQMLRQRRDGNGPL